MLNWFFFFNKWHLHKLITKEQKTLYRSHGLIVYSQVKITKLIQMCRHHSCIEKKKENVQLANLLKLLKAWAFSVDNEVLSNVGFQGVIENFSVPFIWNNNIIIYNIRNYEKAKNLVIPFYLTIILMDFFWDYVVPSLYISVYFEECTAYWLLENGLWLSVIDKRRLLHNCLNSMNSSKGYNIHH